jgi:photosystem II stability/assembly factor-like uncharacterized protein
MSTRILFTLLVILFPFNHSFTQGNWYFLENAPHTDAKFADCFFLNSSTGWVVDVNGKVYKTTDGGNSWTMLIDVLLEFNIPGFSCITFVNEQKGWAGNQNYVNPDPNVSLFESTNGGVTWANISDRISGAYTEGLNSLWAIDSLTIYGAGVWYAPSNFIKTSDGGNSWTSIALNPLIDGIKDLWFFNADTGLVVGARDINRTLPGLYASKPVILFTTDSGTSWERHFTKESVGDWAYKISFPSSNIGYVSVQGPGRNLNLVKTIDGGISWNEINVAEGMPVTAVGFVTNLRGWISTENDTSFGTTDGGYSWVLADIGEHIDRFRFLGDTLGYSAGKSVYKFSSDSSTMSISKSGNDLPTIFNLRQNYPNPFNNSSVLIYSVSQSADIEIKVYDVLGNEIETLVNEKKQTGSYEITWYAEGLPSGVYFYRLQAGDYIETKKMVLMK